MNLLYAVGGLLVGLVAALGIAFVWAPLGLFVWVGLPHDAILFDRGDRFLATTLLAVYYLGVAAALRLAPRGKRGMVGFALLGVWGIGFAGFLQAYQAIVARYGDH